MFLHLLTTTLQCVINHYTVLLTKQYELCLYAVCNIMLVECYKSYAHSEQQVCSNFL